MSIFDIFKSAEQARIDKIARICASEFANERLYDYSYHDKVAFCFYIIIRVIDELDLRSPAVEAMTENGFNTMRKIAESGERLGLIDSCMCAAYARGGFGKLDYNALKERFTSALLRYGVDMQNIIGTRYFQGGNAKMDLEKSNSEWFSS